MKTMILALGAALAIASAPVAAVVGQSYGSWAAGNGDQIHLRLQDSTQLQAKDQTRDRDHLQLHDGTGVYHVNYDGTLGDMHRYQGL